MMYIIGLGNPGKEYELTRHNVAWLLLDAVAGNFEYDKYINARVATATLAGSDFTFLKPETFMNNSGEVVPHLLKKGMTSEELVVVQDDIDLPLGSFRISYDRGDGGHNGIKSIVAVLGTKEFLRIRVGISMKDEEGILRKPNVLGKFSEEEMNKLVEVKKTFKELLETLAKDGKGKAMTEFNK